MSVGSALIVIADGLIMVFARASESWSIAAVGFFLIALGMSTMTPT